MADPFQNLAAVGRDVAVLVAISNSSTVPADIEFEELAAVRGLEFGAEWDTVDTTARGTGSGFSRTSLVTYKNNNLSIDGLVIINNAFQLEVEDHIDNPPASMNFQPYCWVRVVEPRAAGATRISDYPVMLSSFRKSAPYDGEFSYTMEAMGQGDAVKQDVPAPVGP